MFASTFIFTYKGSCVTPSSWTNILQGMIYEPSGNLHPYVKHGRKGRILPMQTLGHGTTTSLWVNRGENVVKSTIWLNMEVHLSSVNTWLVGYPSMLKMTIKPLFPKHPEDLPKLDKSYSSNRSKHLCTLFWGHRPKPDGVLRVKVQRACKRRRSSGR